MDFDARWNFGQPDSTEAIFRTYSRGAVGGDVDYLAQLLTQIARTQGLQRQFAAAHATSTRSSRCSATRSRWRGCATSRACRTFNSSKHPDKARPLFLDAWERSRAIGADFYAVDAAHMIAIVEPPDSALAWNQRALAVAEASSSSRAKKWLGSLYNNLGWTYTTRATTRRRSTCSRRRSRSASRKGSRRRPGSPGGVSPARSALSRGRGGARHAGGAQAEFDAIGEEDGYVTRRSASASSRSGGRGGGAELRPAHELLSKDRARGERAGADHPAQELGAGAAGGTDSPR